MKKYRSGQRLHETFSAGPGPNVAEAINHAMNASLQAPQLEPLPKFDQISASAGPSTTQASVKAKQPHMGGQRKSARQSQTTNLGIRPRKPSGVVTTKSKRSKLNPVEVVSV